MNELPRTQPATAVVANPVDLPGMIVLRNILVATDFSPASEMALDYAVAIARRYESHLYIVHAIRPELYALTPPEATGGMVEIVRQAAEQEMANLLISGRLREVPHQAMVEEGDVWSVLAELTSKHHADLIVVGTHGRSGLEKMFLGSVAERVFRLSMQPVLTVGPKVSKQAPAEIALKNVVYATDFGPTSLRALPYALSLAQEYQAKLTLIHVAGDRAGASTEDEAKISEASAERLQQMLPPGADLWCFPEFLAVFGPLVESILAAARQRSADLLVLGIRGGGAVTGHLPAANAYRLVREATCPVLTVRG
ncbi:MAG TPA: universal stress protein [Candidatus Acidoferrales bacterium]|nr:universal stress protein [Candidatus Acidoferrales bacterium]